MVRRQRIQIVTDALLVFAATYVSVFTLGLQSLNVNQGHYVAAAVTSFFIGSGHILLYKYMPDSGALQLAGYYLGGILGITSSIWFHKRVRSWWAERKQRRIDEHASQHYPACAVCGTEEGRGCPRLLCERDPAARH